MVRLIVTEKPSVARDIARVVGAARRQDTHFEGDGVWVTWSFGHLVEIAEPHEHDPAWKRWVLDALPMLPERLRLRPIARTRDRLRELGALFARPEVGEVVNACDAGREGELIFRWVAEVARLRKPVLRLWLASLTPAAIRQALARLRPAAQYDPLGDAARCRAEADWLVGLNVTRGLTCRARRGGGASALLSVGRVQTPTLALLVARERELEAFVPETYWIVRAALEAPARDGARFEGRWVDPRRKGEAAYRLPSAERAAEVAAALRAAGEGRVEAAVREEQQVPPPQLHHLTSLQQEANRRFGLSADGTLQAAQALYERHKLITYPRTDSRHLSRDVAATLGEVVAGLARLEELAPCGAVAARLAQGSLPTLGRRVVDDAQVGDHHALIPTGRAALAGLSRDELRVFELVARRFLAAFLPPARYAKARVDVRLGEHLVRAEGRTRLDPGWEEVEPPARRARATGAPVPEPPALPPVEPGEPIACRGARVQRKETQPPPRYTEATLLSAMEHAGRSLDEAALREAMRGAGLGTAATRAAIIETLLRRGYVRRSGKSLVPEPLGRALIDVLPVEALASARLTGEWEERLARIAAGRADPEAFRRDIRSFTAAAVEAIRAAEVSLPAEAAASAPGGRRARSGRTRGKASRAGRAAGGSARGSSRRATGAKRARGDEDERGGGASRASRAARAARPGASAPAPEAVAKRASGAGRPRCKACGQGRIVRGRRGWGCDRWRAGCGFVVWFVQDGIEVPEAEADRLFRRGATRLFASSPRTGRRAKLVLDLAVSGYVRWEESARGRAR